MLSFLNRSTNSPKTALPLLSFIETDWHCHLLPGIDDGAQTEAETLAMLQEYGRLGINKIVATPHVHSDFFRNTPQTINEALATTQRLIAQHQISVEVEAAAEYFADEYFMDLIERDLLLPIDNQYILFELPMNQPSLLGSKVVEKIQKKGYLPVLAHPERYRYWHNKPLREVEKWKEKGVYFQLNLLSLTGHYGQAERKTAEQFLEANLIDAVGTDAHGTRHLQKLAQLAGSPYFETLQQLPLLNRGGL